MTELGIVPVRLGGELGEMTPAKCHDVGRYGGGRGCLGEGGGGGIGGDIPNYHWRRVRGPMGGYRLRRKRRRSENTHLGIPRVEGFLCECRHPGNPSRNHGQKEKQQQKGESRDGEIPACGGDREYYRW